LVPVVREAVGGIVAVAKPRLGSVHGGWRSSSIAGYLQPKPFPLNRMQTQGVSL
jgi:hypothetical protein